MSPLRTFKHTGTVPVECHVVSDEGDGPFRVIVAMHGLNSTGQAMIADVGNAPMRAAKGRVVVGYPTAEQGYQFRSPEFLRGMDEWLSTLPDALGAEAMTNRLWLAGFSAGAQCVSRYAMRFPERVEAVVAFAGGNWTLPDGTLIAIDSQHERFRTNPDFNAPWIHDEVRRPAVDGWQTIRWLIGCGTQDERQSVSRQFHDTLTAAGAKADYLEWDAAHRVPVDVWRQAFGWLAESQ